MQFRSIITADERETFRTRFLENSGVTLPDEYCAAGKVIGGYDSTGTMVGGFVIAPGPLMRWPKQLPTVSPLLQRVPVDRMIELNGLWLARSERRGAEAAQLWACVGETIYATGASYVTYSTDTRKRGLMKLYNRISSGRIYEGPFKTAAFPVGAVFYLRPWRIQVLLKVWATGLLQPFLFRNPEDSYSMPIRKWYPLGWLKKRLKNHRRQW